MPIWLKCCCYCSLFGGSSGPDIFRAVNENFSTPAVARILRSALTALHFIWIVLLHSCCRSHPVKCFNSFTYHLNNTAPLLPSLASCEVLQQIYTWLEYCMTHAIVKPKPFLPFKSGNRSKKSSRHWKDAVLFHNFFPMRIVHPVSKYSRKFLLQPRVTTHVLSLAQCHSKSVRRAFMP